MENFLEQMAQALVPLVVRALVHGGHIQNVQNGNPAAQAGAGFGGGQATSGFSASTPQPNPAAAQQQQLGQTNMFASQPQQAATPAVTPDMIQQLITPLVQHEQIKAALTAQMQQMGIQNLPDARPDQLPELYQRFQMVQQQAQQAGLLNAPQGGAPSII